MSTDLPAAMAALLDGVTRVRVLDSGVAGGRALADKPLCELVGDDAAGLLARLAVTQPSQGFHCMCLGHPALELWAGAKRRATLGLHHGLAARVDGWWSDAPLADGEALLRWLADRGVEAPLAELLAARARERQSTLRREAWLAAAPAAVRPRLPALEGAGQLLPRTPRATDTDVREAAEAVRAELGPRTAAALLAWYGGSGGPWSGYPSYESVAEALLGCVPIDASIAAGDTDDSAVLLGLARWLSRHGAPPRERAHADGALRARLTAVVAARGDEDMQARLAAAIDVSRRPANDGRPIGDAAHAPTLSRPVACADAWAAIDGERVVRFERGHTRGTTRAELPTGSAALAAVGHDLVVALFAAGEIWRVPIADGPPRVVARDQQCPGDPVGIDGLAAWLEQPRLANHRTRTRVRLEGDAAPLAEHDGNAWDLLVCAGALWWARHGGSIWSALFGKKIHRVDLMRVDLQTRRSQAVTVLEGGEDGTSVPRLFTDGARIAWTSGTRVGVLDPRSGDRRWFEPDAEVLAAHPRGDGLLVALARDRAGELVHLHPDGTREVLARWQRPPWERERLAVRGDEVAWNAGEHLWSVALDRPREGRLPA